MERDDIINRLRQIADSRATARQLAAWTNTYVDKTGQPREDAWTVHSSERPGGKRLSFVVRDREIVSTDAAQLIIALEGALDRNAKNARLLVRAHCEVWATARVDERQSKLVLSWKLRGRPGFLYVPLSVVEKIVADADAPQAK